MTSLPTLLPLAAQTFASTVMAGVIWTMQLVHYPLFALVGRDAFALYERAHMSRITLIVAPMMLLELVCAIWFVVRTPLGIPRWIPWLGLAMVIALWLSTATLQGPTHTRLASEFSEERIRFLVNTNWLRTILWTARAILAIAMLILAAQHIGAAE